MPYLDLERLMTRTESQQIKDKVRVNPFQVEMWIMIANGYLQSLDLDSDQEGFEYGIQYIAQNIVETLAADTQQSSVLAANSPFRQEKMGSYSYTLKSGADLQQAVTSGEQTELEGALTPAARTLLQKYRLANTDKLAVHTTKVFTDHPVIGFR